MYDAELKRLLKSAKVPEREDAYWEGFPRRVVAGLRCRPARDEVPAPRWIPRLAWGLGVVAVCVLIGFVAGRKHGQQNAAVSNASIPSSAKDGINGLLQNEALIREMLAMFSGRLRAVVQDENGVSLVLSDEPDVPASAPLWVKVSRGNQSLALVTFSGQELRIAGQKVTVLSDARDGVILMGERFAWASDAPGLAPPDLRIQAQKLELASAQ